MDEAYQAGLQIENNVIADLQEAGLSQNKTLETIGLAKSTFHERRCPRPRKADPVPHKERPHPAQLTPEEDQQIRVSLEDSDKSVAETYWDDVDAGVAVASLSTYQRRARSWQIEMASTGPTVVKTRACVRAAPVLVACYPGQVACWDISFLPGPDRGSHFALYLVMDLFSRAILAWTIQNEEDSYIARDLIASVIDKHPHLCTVHSDNGNVMTSTIMKELLARRKVSQSLIRPRVSNDNAQCESIFRTIKYGPAWPSWFDSIEHARNWMTEFVQFYNEEHHHTALAGFTPASVYDGTWIHVANQRQHHFNARYHAHPERYRKPPTVVSPPAQMSLNLAHKERQTHTPPTLAEIIGI